MRVGIISDIHSNIFALDAVLAELGRLGVDRLICNGDVAWGLVAPAQAVDRVRELDIPCVIGNTDEFPVHAERFHGHADLEPTWQWVVNDLGQERIRWLARLPLRRTDLDGRLLQFHGAPTNNQDLFFHRSLNPAAERAPQEMESLLAAYPEPIVTFGHSHWPSVSRLGPRLLINPGSVSHQIHTGDPRARFAILEGIGDNWTAILYAIDYDAERAAQAAEALGLPQSPGAAYQLRNGRMMA